MINVHKLNDRSNLQSREPDKDSEETDDVPEQSIFKEVTEVRFPAEVGPLGMFESFDVVLFPLIFFPKGTHRLCKIKCIEGMWQGKKRLYMPFLSQNT